MTLQDNSDIGDQQRVSELQIWKRDLNDTVGQREKWLVTAQIYLLIMPKVKECSLALGFQKVDEEWYEYIDLGKAVYYLCI